MRWMLVWTSLTSASFLWSFVRLCDAWTFSQQHWKRKRQTVASARVSSRRLYAYTTSSSSFPSSRSATAVSNREISSSSATSIERQIVRLGRQGQTDAALKLFETLDHPTVRQVNAVLDACGRARPPRLATALDIFERYCGAKPSPSNNIPKKHTNLLQPNVYTFGSLLSVCARAGDVSRALHFLEVLLEGHDYPTLRPNAVLFNTVAAACARADPPQPHVAMQVLRQAQAYGEDMTVVGYNAVLSAAARAAEWQLAMDLFHEMKTEQAVVINKKITNGIQSDDENGNDATQRRLEETDSENNDSPTAVLPSSPRPPRPDAVTYGTVLSACEYGQQWDLVLDYAQEMQDAGYALDGLALTSVLHACQQLGKASLALEYLQQMKSTATPWYERQTAGWERVGMRQPLSGPDAVAYRLAISACARGGAWQDAIRLLHEYCHDFDGGDVVAYTAAINGCEYAGEWKQAFLLLEKMRQTGVEPNDVTFASVIGACATACAKITSAGNGKKANTENEFKSKSESVKEKVEEVPAPLRKALQLLAVLKKDPSVVDPSIQVYNAAIRACAEACDVKRAFRLLDTIRDDEGLQPSLITYGSLMTACERVGNVDAASKVFQLMRDDGIEPNEIIYGAAISCCRKAGQAERAMLLLQKMIRQKLQPNVVVFNTVLVAQAEGRTEHDIQRAILVYKILNSKHYTAASPNRQTYNILIRTFASNRKPREAEVFLRQMQRDGLAPDVDLYTATVSAYERTGQPLRALRLLESMREDGYDFYESAILNAAFKRAVALANVVGRVDNDEEIRQARLELRIDEEENDLN